MARCAFIGMICPSCQQPNPDDAEACFTCGKALSALTQGALLASRYVIRQSLGRGGMGAVYRAFDRMLEEDVAIKVIRSELVREPEMARRFRSETRLARKVSHRNVCRIHEYGEDGGVRYLSMEFVEGVDLKRLLRDGPLGVDLGLGVAVQAAEGLQAVHAHGIIHRDLKPSNLMVDRLGVVRLLDFGIAKEANAEVGLTGSRNTMGTPEYMSPEQARGEKVGYPSDIYALGCVLYEVFVGAPPFHADTPLHTMYKHINDPPPLGARERTPLPDALVPLLRRVLSKKAEERPTAAGLTDALREVLSATGAPAGDLAAAVTAVAGPSRKGPALERHEGSAFPPDPGGRPAPPREAMVTTTLDRGARPPGTWAVTIGSSRRWRWGFGTMASAAALGALALSLRSREPADVFLPALSLSPTAAPATGRTRAGEASSSGPAAGLEGRQAPRPPQSRPSLLPSPRPEGASAGPEHPEPSSSRPLPPARLPPSAMATLSLVIVPPSEVTVDGASLGTVSISEVPLTAGPHVVLILHPDYKPLQRKIHAEAGRTEKIVIDLAEKGIRKPKG